MDEDGGVKSVGAQRLRAVALGSPGWVPSPECRWAAEGFCEDEKRYLARERVSARGLPVSLSFSVMQNGYGTEIYVYV